MRLFLELTKAAAFSISSLSSVPSVTALVVLAILGAPATTAAEASDRIGDFSLLDAEGYFHQVSWYDNHKAVVLLSYADDDKSLSSLLDAYTQLRDSAGESFAFFLIDSQARHNRDDIAKGMRARNFDIPVLMDDAQLVGEALALTASGEVLVFDPKRFSIIARGAGSQALAGVRQLLAQLDTGGDITAAAAAVGSTAQRQGVEIRYAAREAHTASTPSYVNDIAPIIAENCASCHREGGIAPFAMDSYTMVLGWSPMIREVLLTKRMPPGQIDSHIGEFINDMVLAESDTQKLIHWIGAGATYDGETAEADPLAQLTWPTSEWAFGEPDYIIEIPPQ